MFARFVDFDKAFDNVDYWSLFSIYQLFYVVCASVVILVQSSIQYMFVSWQCAMSSGFSVNNS